MEHKRKKILFAAVDIGYRIELYSKFIQNYHSKELLPESLCTYVLPKEHYRTAYTYEHHFHQRNSLYRWFRSVLNFFFCLYRFDIFHFISGETLLTRKFRKFELFIYKLCRKRVIMHFVGSDIRNPEYIIWKSNNIKQFLQGEDTFPKTKKWQDLLIKDAIKYSDHILVSTPDLCRLIPSAEYYPVMLDLVKFKKELQEAPELPKDKDEIVILHSPSNLQLKGSDIIHNVLIKIASSSTQKIKIVTPGVRLIGKPKDYPVSRYEIFSLYKEADIVIDQLIIGWYGLQSVEALAAGKSVICYIDKDLENKLFPDCPIHLADANTLEKILIQCIHDITNHKDQHSEFSKKWVEKYHTIEKNNNALEKAWGLTSITD